MFRCNDLRSFVALLNTGKWRIEPLAWTLSAVLALAPDLCAAQTASRRLETFAAQVQERALDLFPVSEIFSHGPGPRQDRLELTLGDEHRERQRAYNRWILEALESIPAAELSPTEKLTHALLARRARDALEWLAYPFHQHSAFIHLNPGIALGDAAGNQAQCLGGTASHPFACTDKQAGP
jgi:hypothetical protein